jgi:ketosteroid isomerase-like protein
MTVTSSSQHDHLLDFWLDEADGGTSRHEPKEPDVKREASASQHARTPEDLTRLFVERSNAGDADGVAALYEPDAVVAFPPGGQTVGRAAIRELWAQVLAERPYFEPEEPLPTLRTDDLALTVTARKDGVGVRVQVARRQPDGSWLRALDHPELAPPST